MFQNFLLLGTSFATVEDASHRPDARNCAQRHRPVAFATEGLRLVLCFAFNCGIRPESQPSSESAAIQPPVRLRIAASRRKRHLLRAYVIAEECSASVLPLVPLK